MSEEVEDNFTAEPETEKPQAPSGKAIASSSSIHGDAETSSEEEVHKKTLEYAEILIKEGSAASGMYEYAKAMECYSRILQIHVNHFGELGEECFTAYYFYGCAMLRNALVGICPYTPAETKLGYVSSDDEDSATGLEEEIDTDDTPDNDEDESELDLAWKILDIARVILERQPAKSILNVHVLCALGEINCYRDDLKTSLLDFLQAEHILESLDEPDFMDKSRLYFNIGSCLEVTVMTKQAILYFEKSLKNCCSMLSVLEKDRCRYSSTKEVPPPNRSSTIISAIEEQIASARDYSIMLEIKLNEIREFEQSSLEIREAIDALSAKVRKVSENDVSSSSTSTDVKVRHLGKLGGSGKKVSVGIYSDSIKLSPLKKPKFGESEAGN